MVQKITHQQGLFGIPFWLVKVTLIIIIIGLPQALKILPFVVKILDLKPYYMCFRGACYITDLAG